MAGLVPHAVNSTARHLLMLVHRIPYPPDKGDKIRSFHELRYLREKGWHIHLCTFIDDPEDLGYVKAVGSYCETASFNRLRSLPQKASMAASLLRGKPLSVGAFYKRRAGDYINRVLSDYPVQAILCFSSPMAEYVFECPKLNDHPNQTNRTNSSVLVMDLIDVDSDKWRQYASRADALRKMVYRLESRRLAAYEKRITEAFDAAVVVSEAEAELLRRITGAGSKVHGIPNGVDTAYFHPAPPASIKGPACTLVFCGLMDYHPNVDAVVWFSNEVLPALRERLGEVCFHIVGARPSREVRSLQALPGVRVLGRVEDVRPHVWSADISVAPIRIARGIQNKVLEAMAMGKPVVATAEAFEGLEAVPGKDLLVTDADPSQFTEAVASLSKDKARSEEMGRSARKRVLENYAWESRMAQLEALLHS